MFLVCGVDLVAPLARLPIQILPTGERAPSQKVVFDEPERPFYAGGTIGIPNRMRYEPNPETLSKRGHLRHGNHLAPSAAQHHDVRVVDHDAFARAAEVAYRIGQKHLAVETLKRRVALKEQHPRVAQHARCGLYLALLAGQLDLVWRRVVLHLLARLEVVLARRHDGRLPDTLLSAEGGQRRIRQGHSLGCQFLMDSHEILLAGIEKLQDPLPVGFGFLGPRYLRERGRVRAHDFAHRQTGDSQHPRDLVLALSLGAEFQNRGALRLAQHAALAPAGFSRPDGEVGFPGVRSGAALLRVAAHPSRRQRPPPVAGWRGSQSPPPSPDRAGVLRPALP